MVPSPWLILSVISWRLVIVALSLRRVVGQELVELLRSARRRSSGSPLSAVLSEPSESWSCLPRPLRSVMSVFRSGDSAVLDLRAVGERGRAGRPHVDRDVVAADEPGHLDGRRRVARDRDLRVDFEDGLRAAAGQPRLCTEPTFTPARRTSSPVLSWLQVVEAGDKRVLARLEDLAAAQRLVRHPHEGDAEEEEEPDAGGLLALNSW